MRKWIPLLLTMFSIIVFSALILKNEYHLKNSQSIYVKLQPVDPRSLIQGDYMMLNYQLYLAPQNTTTSSSNGLELSLNAEEQIFSGYHYDQLIKNKSSILSYVELDQQARVIHTFFEMPKDRSTSKLVLQNPNNHSMFLYPASKSFLFSEGLAECYQQAQYAEFKVDQQGNAILASLRGEHLQDLGCEAQRSWFDGFKSPKDDIDT